MPTLLIRGPDGGEHLHEISGEATVGRADGNDLVLAEGGVSRRHARFFVEGGTLLVEDLGSANGTWVDGERIEAPTEVGPGSQVVIGDYEIALKPAPARSRWGPKVGGAAAPNGRPSGAELAPSRSPRATRAIPKVDRPAGAPAAPAAAPRRAPRAEGQIITGPSLRGLTGPWANKLYPIRGTVTVGRVAGVQIQIEDESVSRRHAELERTADGVLLRDLGSANGTTVNGEPVEGEVLLQPGDIVAFGMIELAYEVGDEAALAAPTRRSGGRAARPAAGRRAGPAAAGGLTPERRKGLLIAGAGVGVLLCAGVVMKLAGPGPEPVEAGGPALPSPLDPSAKVEALLAECRSWAATDLGQEPNWEKAREICEQARALDPINPQVISQIQRISLEVECKKNFDQGRKLMDLNREEEALEYFGKINEACSYYPRVKPRAREAIELVKQKAKRDCAQYAKSGFWEQALDRCEKYMTFACQSMKDEELNPPPGYEIHLEGRMPQRGNYWRPKDPMYLNLLRARKKRDPDMGPWMCPPVELFREDVRVTDPSAEVKKIFKERYREKLMQEAMELYWDGKGAEATVKLMRLRENRDKALVHQQADEMRLDIAAVENLYKTGSTYLKTDDIDKAAEAFREALVADRKLMADLTETKPSFYRRTIESDMARAAYEGGKHWADRSDPRKGCKIWKLGFSFYRGNADLNKAVGYCSNQGQQRLQAATSCADLEVVLDFAVEGDGLQKRVEEKKAEWGC